PQRWRCWKNSSTCRKPAAAAERPPVITNGKRSRPMGHPGRDRFVFVFYLLSAPPQRAGGTGNHQGVEDKQVRAEQAGAEVLRQNAEQGGRKQDSRVGGRHLQAH